MTSYCTAADLLLGNIPTPSDADTYVQDAADEIDSLLGMRYESPIVLSEDDPVQRPGALLLKRINVWLASGRLIMALDGAGEDDQVHQYAKYLMTEAKSALQNLSDGSIILPGGVPINPDSPVSTGPQASWGDDASPVEQYQTVFGNNASTALKDVSPAFFGLRSGMYRG